MATATARKTMKAQKKPSIKATAKTKKTKKTKTTLEKKQVKKLLKRAEKETKAEAKPKKTTKTKTKSKKTTKSKTTSKKKVVLIEKPKEEKEYESLLKLKEGQITKEEMRKMSMTKRVELWRKLNKGEDKHFISITPPEGLLNYTRYAEVEHELPNKPKNTLYCPYCRDWNIFRRHTVLDSKNCIGCGISDNDFYVKSDNHLWKSKGK